MGFIRKALFVGTGGASGAVGIKANSKKERIAKASERQLVLERGARNEQERAERMKKIDAGPDGVVVASTFKEHFRIPWPGDCDHRHGACQGTARRAGP